MVPSFPPSLRWSWRSAGPLSIGSSTRSCALVACRQWRQAIKDVFHKTVTLIQPPGRQHLDVSRAARQARNPPLVRHFAGGDTCGSACTLAAGLSECAKSFGLGEQPEGSVGVHLQD